MKILFAINSLDTGGAENFMLRLAKYFVGQGHQIGLYSLQPIENKHKLNLRSIFSDSFEKIKCLEPYKPSSSFDVFLWRMNGLLNRFGIMDFRKKYLLKKSIQSIHNFNPDVINSHLFESDLFLSSLDLFPLVISMHGPYEYYLHKSENDDGGLQEISVKKKVLNDAFIAQAKQVLNKAKAVIYCADKNLEIFEHFEAKPLTFKIYYGFEDPKVTKKLNKEVKNITMFGRGVASKGWEESILAFQEISKIHKNIILHFAYTHSEFMESLKAKYAHLDSVVFHEALLDLADFLRDKDLMLFPSYYPGESLPNVIIESLFYGLPVISTDHGEIKSMLNYAGGSAGICISLNGDGKVSIDDLCTAINEILNDSDLFADYQKNTSKIAQQFAMDKCYESYLDVFKTVSSLK